MNAIDDCYHGGVDWSDGGTCRRLGFGFGSNASSMAKGHDHVIAHAGVQQIEAVPVTSVAEKLLAPLRQLRIGLGLIGLGDATASPPGDRA